MKKKGYPDPASEISLSIDRPWIALTFLFKLVFGSSAYGAYPVTRQLLKRGPWFYAVIRITSRRIIHVTANRAHKLVHEFSSSSFFLWPQSKKMLKISPKVVAFRMVVIGRPEAGPGEHLKKTPEKLFTY
jgi:hypothetical protein